MDALYCHCCGDTGAESDSDGLFFDGQSLICGCPGQVSCDSETPAHIMIYDEVCQVCTKKVGEV